MTADEYPINFPYGKKLSPFYGSMIPDGYNGTVAPAHHGDDRACPIGTPVRVGDTIIGYTGKTGTVTGPHLHNDKYKPGRYSSGVYIGGSVNRTYFKPSNGFDISGKVILSTYSGTAGNMVVIQGNDGYFYRYLHLNSRAVSVGKVINVYEEDGEMVVPLTETRARRQFYSERGRLPTDDELSSIMKKKIMVTPEWNAFYDAQYNHPGAVTFRKKKVAAGL